MSIRSTRRITKVPSCINAAREAADVPNSNFLDLPPEVRRIIYACLLEPYSEDHAYDRMPYHHSRVTRGPNEIAIFWDDNLLDDIRGLVLASKTCFEDFQSCLPAIVMCMHEGNYQGDKVLPAMFREKIVTLMLRDCLMHTIAKSPHPGIEVEDVRQKLSLFPQLTAVEVYPDPLVYRPVNWVLPISDRARALLRCEGWEQWIQTSSSPFPGSVLIDDMNCGARDILSDLRYDGQIGTKSFELIRFARPDIRLTIKWTICLLQTYNTPRGTAAVLLYNAVEEILENGGSSFHFKDFSHIMGEKDIWDLQRMFPYRSAVYDALEKQHESAVVEPGFERVVLNHNLN